MLDQVPSGRGDHLPVMLILFLALGQITALLDGALDHGGGGDVHA